MKKFFVRFYMTARASRAAFTLVEMLVVIGITTIVSVAAIVYSTAGQNEVALTVETAKIAQLVLQARELALDTYRGTNSACAYGVHFDLSGQTYSLFAYTPGTPRCPAVETVASSILDVSKAGGVVSAYAPSSWQLPVANGVMLIRPGDVNIPSACVNVMTDVLFYPPAPATLVALAGNGEQFSSPAPPASTICLRTDDGKNTAVITVTPAGQVSF